MVEEYKMSKLREQFENSEEKERNLTRRNFLKCLGFSTATTIALSSGVSALLPNRNLITGKSTHDSTDSLTISGGSSSDPKEYIIKAEEISKRSGRGTVLEENAVGSLQGGSHSYEYRNIQDLRAEEGVEVRRNGQVLSVTQIVNLCSSGSSSGGSGGEAAVGGGDAYPGQKYTESDADYVVTSLDELENVMDDQASSGDVVYVPENTTIYFGTTTVNIPDGVTLASNRGVNGSEGGRLFADNENSFRMTTAQNNTTLAGLRYHGPNHSDFGGDYGDLWDHAGIGHQMLGDDNEIVNCKVGGFVYDAIRTEGENRVRYCHIHNNSTNGLGYGVQVFGGSDETVIEYCEFDRNRHCIAGQGTGGYIARNNIVRERQLHHAFDHHGTGGKVEIYNNRFEMLPDTVDIYPSAYRQRDPAENTIIHHNWAYNDTGEGDGGDATWHISGGNYEIRDNHLGESSPPEGVGLDL